MVSSIDIAIAQANFEIVRDQIGAIIKVELDKQAALWGTQPQAGPPAVPGIPNNDLTAEVFIERLTPVDRSEGNVINVVVNSMDLDNQNQFTQRNSVVFAIDVFTNALETEAVDGCYLSGAKLHRLIGLIRSILQSPIYVKLGFQSGIVESRSVYKVLFSEKDDNHDTINSRMARIFLKVAIHEKTTGITPIEAGSYSTIVKLELTEKGYKFNYVNT
jgi:hypothetical protein